MMETYIARCSPESLRSIPTSTLGRFATGISSRSAANNGDLATGTISVASSRNAAIASSRTA